MSQRPLHTLLFLISVFTVFAIDSVSFLLSKGVFINENLTLRFPDLNSVFKSEQKSKKTDISKIIALADAKNQLSDSLQLGDTLSEIISEVKDSSVA